MIGDGSEANSLKKKMPQITWIGYVPNHKIPDYLVKAKCFFHTSLNDFLQRVIPEAAACGLPVIAFQDAIKEDVLPAKIGLRIKKETVNQQILSLLKDEESLRMMGDKARIHAVKRWNKKSTLPILERLFPIK
jgi:glycosyltransferase involved in cell wall biosynthesis